MDSATNHLKNWGLYYIFKCSTWQALLDLCLAYGFSSSASKTFQILRIINVIGLRLGVFCPSVVVFSLVDLFNFADLGNKCIPLLYGDLLTLSVTLQQRLIYFTVHCWCEKQELGDWSLFTSAEGRLVESLRPLSSKNTNFSDPSPPPPPPPQFKTIISIHKKVKSILVCHNLEQNAT